MKKEIDTGHVCDSPATVVVEADGERVGLPIIDEGVTVHEYKNGPTSLGRRAEIHFPISGNEEDLPTGYTSWWDTFLNDPDFDVDSPNTARAIPFDSPSQPQAYPIEIYAKPLAKDGTFVEKDEQILFYGLIHTLGSLDSGGDNTGRVEAIDVGKRLTSLPASKEFVYTPNSFNSVENLLEYVRDELVDNLPYIGSIPIEGGGVDQEAFIGGNISGSKQFKANRDTLDDVITYVEKTFDLRVWFEPTDIGELTLRAEQDPATERGNFYDQDGRPHVIENDALAEIRPYNTLVLKGDTGERIEGPGSFSVKNPVSNDRTYPEGKAVYPPLVAQNGGTEVKAVETSDATTEQALANEARSLLKQQLDERSGGTVTTTLDPRLRPYDRFQAVPICTDIRETTPLPLEVERTAHTYSPDGGEDNDVPQTEIATSLAVDPTKIEVSTTTKDALPTEGQGEDNAPSPSQLDDLLVFDTNTDD